MIIFGFSAFEYMSRNYLILHHKFYSAENRWPDSEFWKRRQLKLTANQSNVDYFNVVEESNEKDNTLTDDFTVTKVVTV